MCCYSIFPTVLRRRTPEDPGRGAVRRETWSMSPRRQKAQGVENKTNDVQEDQYMGNPAVHFEIGGKERPEGCASSTAGCSTGSSSSTTSWAATPRSPSATSGIGGGIMQTAEGMPPNYTAFYIQVDDVQATLDKVEAGGGSTLLPPTPIPDSRHHRHVRRSGRQRHRPLQGRVAWQGQHPPNTHWAGGRLCTPRPSFTSFRPPSRNPEAGRLPVPSPSPRRGIQLSLPP